MNKKLAILLYSAAIICSPAAHAKDRLQPSSERAYFIENKGQIRDQNKISRPDVHFALQSQGLNVFVGTGKLQYQFTHIQNIIRTPRANDNAELLPHMKFNKDCFGASIASYRMDVTLLGANMSSAPVADDKQRYFENYYNESTGDNGIQAHTFRKITYKNVYPAIDWVLYLKNGHLEHEFVVRSGGDPSLIRVKYSGQSALFINSDGSLTATTPMGTINEHAPICFNAAGQTIPSSFVLQDNILTYNLNGYKGDVTIDPEVEWGTYYGPDSSTSPFYDVSTDDAANVYACGLTWSSDLTSIATTGEFQETFGGTTDAYLVKFDSSGDRLWATYYGGIGGDWATGVGVDRAGSVYITGNTSSPTGIASTGAQQPTYGGGTWDGFIAKFDKNGVRKWGTYVGGRGANFPTSLSCDKAGHIYVAGDSNDTNNIATPSGFKPVKGGGFDCFLIQYDTLGVRTWGTYYGGSRDEFGGVHCTDGNFVYLSGWTPSTTGIATPFSYQSAFGGGGADDYLVKFTSTGIRLWGTYYGGSESESIGGITTDPIGNIYMLGSTTSDNGMAESTSEQSLRSGGNDAFIAKFTAELGFREWGTYYGGPDAETTDLSRIAADDSGNVYVTGFTASTTGIATAGSIQPTFAGGTSDGFIAKYFTDGTKEWSTYYGGAGTDEARACAFDGLALYVCGQTTSAENIATPDGFLPVGGGRGGSFLQGFLTKIRIRIDTTSVIDTTTDTPTSMTPIVQHSLLKLYPSPNNGSFTISGDLPAGSKSAQLKITDINGKTVWTEEVLLNNGRIKMQMTAGNKLPSGSYLIKVTSGKFAEVVKFLIE